jgi:hypothetical protein
MMFRINQAWLDRMPLPPDIKNAGHLYTFFEDDVEHGRVMFALTRPDGNTCPYPTSTMGVLTYSLAVMVFLGQHETNRSPPANLAELKVVVEGLNTVEPIPHWVFKVMDMLEEVSDSAAVANLKVGVYFNFFQSAESNNEPAPTHYVRYHQATNLPANWVALGDSVMTRTHIVHPTNFLILMSAQ